jgi:hypothetical protein
VAGVAGGTEWEENEVVEEDQSGEKDDRLTDELLAELRDSCKHFVGLEAFWD